MSLPRCYPNPWKRFVQNPCRPSRKTAILYSDICLMETRDHMPPPEQRPRILIADDNPQGAELLEAFLADQPLDTRLVHNGEQVLVEALQWQPDIVLLDVMMPRISGFDACYKLRKDPATRDIGVIMVTALDQPADIDRAVASGTDDLITKPVNRYDLIARIHGLLAARQSKGNATERFLNYIGALERGNR